MAARRRPSPTPGYVDFRATDDDAWWPVKLRLEDDGDAVLRVMYQGFSESESEGFAVDGFRTSAEVDDFAARFRLTSIQLQDSECELVVEGMEICASHAFGESDVRFYNAIVEEVNFSKHTWCKGEESCSCTFVILWQHGPLAGEKTPAGIENICFLQSRGLKMDPVLDHFLDMAKKKCETRNPVFGSTVRRFHVSSRHGHEFTRDLDSSGAEVACSIGNLGSTVIKPQFSPSQIEQPEAYDPVWTYCHAFMRQDNLVECSFCGGCYACSMKVKCHLACIGGHTKPCLSVPTYWKIFYSRYIRMSSKKPWGMIAADIQQELDADVAAGRIPFPADRETVAVGSSHEPHHRSSSLRGSTSSRSIPHVLEHHNEEYEEDPSEEEEEPMACAGDQHAEESMTAGSSHHCSPSLRGSTSSPSIPHELEHHSQEYEEDPSEEEEEPMAGTGDKRAEESMTAMSSHHCSSSLRGSTSSPRIPEVLEHHSEEDEEDPIEEDEEEMAGTGDRRAEGESMMMDTSERGWWERKLRMRLQRCFKHYGIPDRVVRDPDFEVACRHIAASAKAGYDDILPSPQEMSIWILSDSEDEDC